jgi:cell division protein FtsN
MKANRHFYLQTAGTFLIIFCCLLAGCAGTGSRAGGAREITPRQGPDSIPPPPSEQAGEAVEGKTAREPYDLESEKPEDDAVDESDSEREMIDPLRADSFTVEESAEASEKAVPYDLGYRIQLAAFEEPAAARELKKKVMAATGMAVYIDYEDGLYKVRAGDFHTRAEASEERARLKESYEDCWIVRTTILKAR